MSMIGFEPVEIKLCYHRVSSLSLFIQFIVSPTFTTELQALRWNSSHLHACLWAINYVTHVQALYRSHSLCVCVRACARARLPKSAYFICERPFSVGVCIFVGLKFCKTYILFCLHSEITNDIRASISSDQQASVGLCTFPYSRPRAVSSVGLIEQVFKNIVSLFRTRFIDYRIVKFD